ncbi:hypothetical protein JD844_032640 [Phrynosoma platyrhinos]|uniref:Uncharacterized protein n=1 Tax=Phrynosoma platyrhinos TaxID=52577 RepID=A0ABQ7T564_PHRPL|nr:hypothetical protein JD844_032640 [Phrynosoma platyrhinos]
MSVQTRSSGITLHTIGAPRTETGPVPSSLAQKGVTESMTLAEKSDRVSSTAAPLPTVPLQSTSFVSTKLISHLTSREQETLATSAGARTTPPFTRLTATASLPPSSDPNVSTEVLFSSAATSLESSTSVSMSSALSSGHSSGRPTGSATAQSSASSVPSVFSEASPTATPSAPLQTTSPKEASLTVETTSSENTRTTGGTPSASTVSNVTANPSSSASPASTAILMESSANPTDTSSAPSTARDAGPSTLTSTAVGESTGLREPPERFSTLTPTSLVTSGDMTFAGTQLPSELPSRKQGSSETTAEASPTSPLSKETVTRFGFQSTTPRGVSTIPFTSATSGLGSSLFLQPNASNPMPLQRESSGITLHTIWASRTGTGPVPRSLAQTGVTEATTLAELYEKVSLIAPPPSTVPSQSTSFASTKLLFHLTSREQEPLSSSAGAITTPSFPHLTTTASLTSSSEPKGSTEVPSTSASATSSLESSTSVTLSSSLASGYSSARPTVFTTAQSSPSSMPSVFLEPSTATPSAPLQTTSPKEANLTLESTSESTSFVSTKLLSHLASREQESSTTSARISDAPTFISNFVKNTGPFYIQLDKISSQLIQFHWIAPTGKRDSPYTVSLVAHNTALMETITNSTKMEFKNLSPGDWYTVSVEVWSCGKKISSSVTVRTEATEYIGTARIINEKYIPQYSNKSSTEFQDFQKNFTAEMNKYLPPVFRELLQSGKMRIIITGIQEGSLIVNFIIEMVPDSNVTHEEVEHAVIEALNRSRTLDVDLTRTSIKVVPVCQPGHNDCSKYATCIAKGDSYTCQCGAGFHDQSPLVPGRQCLDINECTGNNSCSFLASCNNTIGSYKCQCYSGITDLNPTNPGLECQGKQAFACNILFKTWKFISPDLYDPESEIYKNLTDRIRNTVMEGMKMKLGEDSFDVMMAGFRPGSVVAYFTFLWQGQHFIDERTFTANLTEVVKDKLNNQTKVTVKAIPTSKPVEEESAWKTGVIVLAVLFCIALISILLIISVWLYMKNKTGKYKTELQGIMGNFEYT